MIEVYASLLLHSAKQPITEENIKKIISATGANVEETKIKALVASLDGVNIDEAISQAAVAVASAPAASAAPAKKEESAEDQSKKAEEAAAGLSALFG